MSNFYHNHDTIAAIATPPGEGGVAIIRISGKNALSIADALFSGDVFAYQSHKAHYGKVLDKQRMTVDDAILLPMLGKRSYTGEDTVEIHCHGGYLITQRVLDRVLECGARAANPGEFTYRAFLNGKLDLAQAEAVQELIGAKNAYALNAAEQQLQGRLSNQVAIFQSELTEIAAILEAWVDFPEEGIEFASIEEIIEQLLAAKKKMESLVATFHDGKIMREGIAVSLIGSPNVGKSSLMNALLDKERAIVSDIPGTTRDVLEDHLQLNGLNFRLTDTAGIRMTDEKIEIEGIRRSRRAMEEADLILLVIDLSQGLTESDRTLLEEVPKEKTVLVWNKSDLQPIPPKAPEFPHAVTLSAKTREGIEQLKQEIDAVIWEHGAPSQEEVFITNIRHKQALQSAIGFCQNVITGLQEGVSPEFLASDMRQTLIELGKILGTDITEDILSAIFSKFCIGK